MDIVQCNAIDIPLTCLDIPFIFKVDGVERVTVACLGCICKQNKKNKTRVIHPATYYDTSGYATKSQHDPIIFCEMGVFNRTGLF